MADGLLIYMMADARQRNAANRAISMGKQHTDCPTCIFEYSSRFANGLDELMHFPKLRPQLGQDHADSAPLTAAVTDKRREGKCTRAVVRVSKQLKGFKSGPKIAFRLKNTLGGRRRGEMG